MPTQPDPWARYVPTPAKPPRDYGAAPWTDVLTQAATRVIPTYAGDMWNSAKALAHQLTTPISHASLGSASEPLGLSAVRAGLQAVTGDRTYAPQVSAADAVRGAGNYAGARYGSVPALKRTLATDPGGALMDAQAVASIPEGGEGFFGRMRAAGEAERTTAAAARGAPGAPGYRASPNLSELAAGAGQRTGAAARHFNNLTNPVALGATGILRASRAGQAGLRGGPVLDTHGNFTPAVTQAVQQAFPKGEITAAELANPKFRTQLTKTLQTKGITPAAVKEAVLSYNGAPTPRATVTRTPPPKSVAGPVSDAVSQGQQAVTATAHNIVGGPPSQTNVAAALEQAHAGSLAAAQGKYETLRQVPGSFGAKLDGPALNTDISQHLATAEVPSTPELLKRSKDAYPQANAALDLVNGALVKGKTRLGGEVTAPEIMEVRSQLTPMLDNAEGKDRRAVGAVIDGLHQHLENASQAGQFQGPQGAVDISGQLRAANSAYKQHFDTFGNRQGPSASIANAVSSLKGSAKAGLVNDPDAHAAAQRGLASGLNNPTQAPATYSLLSKALGPSGQAALDDYVRQSAVLNPDGSLAKSANIRRAVDGPTGSVFTPQEQSDLRLAAAGQDVLGAKPIGVPGGGSDVAGHAIRTAAAIGAGAVGAHFLPLTGWIPGAPEIGGAMASGAAEQFLEPSIAAGNLRKQLAGAPSAGDYLGIPAGFGKAAYSVARALPVTNAVAETQPQHLDIPPPTAVRPDVDLSSAPGPYDAPEPTAAPTPAPDHGKDPWAPYLKSGDAPAPAGPDPQDLSAAPGPYDDAAPRASGGKVGDDVEHLVTRLQSLAKRAKAATKKATEPLLSVPDAAITKALQVAQRAI